MGDATFVTQLHCAVVVLCCVLQTLLAASDNSPAAFMDHLPAMANVYPVAKLMLAVVESLYKLKVSCSLQALICMLLEEDRVQVGC